MNPDLFYTYIYYDPSRNNEPIYVGKGKNNRVWEHFKSTFNHPFVNRLKHMKNNNVSPVIGIYAGMDEELALLLEVELISKFGRKDLGKGSLLNLTDGGEGVSGRIYSHSAQARANISKSTKGKIMSDDWITKQQNRIHPIKTKSRMANSQKARWKHRKNNGISDPIKSFNHVQGPDRIYRDVHEAAECNNALISAIYRWCDPKTPVKSRPGWSIIKEGQ